METKHIDLFTQDERLEFSELFQRHNYGTGQPLTAAERERYDEFLTRQATQDYRNYWRDNTFSEQEAISYLKAKYVTDNIV